jgi:superfamily II DNA/RNA helicase
MVHAVTEGVILNDASTFAALGLSERVTRALGERDIDKPFAVQSAVIPDALAGHDLLVRSPTGSGKTLAFGLPIVERTPPSGRMPYALVLAPTRELTSQIVAELADIAGARRLTIAAVYGGVGIAAQARKAPRSHVLVATPGRLLDLIDRGDVSLSQVGLLVLDEADRMLDMGFRPVVDRIVAKTRPDRQTLLFSATLDGQVARIAEAYTRKARRHEHRLEPAHHGRVRHRFVHLAHEHKPDRLVAELRAHEHGRTLVFVRTKRGADRLVKRLARHDVMAAAMHGDKSQSQREKALARFEAGRIRTLVATDVAARGIDVAGITHVINYDAPAVTEDYVHRIGRTARAGADGVGTTFVLEDQIGDIAAIASHLGLDAQLRADGVTVGPPRVGSGARRRPRRRR